MITISLDIDTDDSSDAAVARVRAMMDRELLTNPNLSGAEYKIEFDEFTCVVGIDEIAGAQLLNDVRSAIDAIVEESECAQ